MSTHTQKPTYFLSGALPNAFLSAHSVQDALMRGRKASDELKGNYQAPTQRLVSVGRYVEGVSQDFVLHSKNSATVVIPCALTKNVQKADFFRLLEVQRVEHILADMMATSQTPTDVSNRYYSQVLMTQRLQRALLEVELYAFAISKDGLCLLEDLDSEMAFSNRVTDD